MSVVGDSRLEGEIEIERVCLCEEGRVCQTEKKRKTEIETGRD